MSLGTPELLDLKTSLRPSADHAGPASSAGLFVRFVSPLPSGLIVKMSFWPEKTPSSGNGSTRVVYAIFPLLPGKAACADGTNESTAKQAATIAIFRRNAMPPLVPCRNLDAQSHASNRTGC